MVILMPLLAMQIVSRDYYRLKAAYNNSPKIASTQAVAIPLDQQLSQLDDSVRDMSTKILSDSTFSSDSAFVKQFNEMASRREALKLQIKQAETDSTAK